MILKTRRRLVHCAFQGNFPQHDCQLCRKTRFRATNRGCFGRAGAFALSFSFKLCGRPAGSVRADGEVRVRVVRGQFHSFILSNRRAPGSRAVHAQFSGFFKTRVLFYRYITILKEVFLFSFARRIERCGNGTGCGSRFWRAVWRCLWRRHFLSFPA
jgi:hypothetical protein